jgi:hypothetical protein
MVWMLMLVGAEAGGDVPVCKIKGAGRTSVTFTSGTELREREAQRAAAVFEQPQPTPFNGVVEVRVERAVFEQADAGNLLIMFEGASRELARHEPGPREPDPWKNRWVNAETVPLPEPLLWPLTLWVADKAQAQRCGWTMSAPGAAPVLVRE